MRVWQIGWVLYWWSLVGGFEFERYLGAKGLEHICWRKQVPGEFLMFELGDAYKIESRGPRLIELIELTLPEGTG